METTTETLHTLECNYCGWTIQSADTAEAEDHPHTVTVYDINGQFVEAI